jgi:hypothetical protein
MRSRRPPPPGSRIGASATLALVARSTPGRARIEHPSSTVTSRNTPSHIRRTASAHVTTSRINHCTSVDISASNRWGSSPLSSTLFRQFKALPGEPGEPILDYFDDSSDGQRTGGVPHTKTAVPQRRRVDALSRSSDIAPSRQPRWLRRRGRRPARNVCSQPAASRMNEYALGLNGGYAGSVRYTAHGESLDSFDSLDVRFRAQRA